MTPIKTYRLEIGAPEKAMIMLVGCGGTGSYAALHLAQLVYSARSQMEIKLVFVDPDTVEAKNVGRQNFAPCEIGQPKAVTLARRFSAAFGLPIVSCVEKFSAGLLQEFLMNPEYVNLIVGCLDNTQGRRDIHRVLTYEMSQIKEFCGRNLFWLDAGNYHAHGQIYLGNHPGPAPLLSPLGFATAIPLPSVQSPALIAPEDAEPEPALSCADLVALDVQSRTINKMMAAWVDVYCERLLISRDLRMISTHLDQRSGTAYSTPIAGGRVVELVRQSQAPEEADPPRGDTEAYEEEWPDDHLVCPECGRDIIRGQNMIDDEEVDIYFCPYCQWQMPVEEFKARQADLELERLMG